MAVSSDIFPLAWQYFLQMGIQQTLKKKHFHTETETCLCFAAPVSLWCVTMETSLVHRNIIASRSKHPLEFLMKSEKEPAPGPFYGYVQTMCENARHIAHSHYSA